MSNKVFNQAKATILNFHLEATRATYPYLSIKEALVIASLDTIIDGFPGPLLGTDDELQWALTKIKVREMPAKLTDSEAMNLLKNRLLK